MKKKREIEKFGHNKKMEKNCQVRKKWIKLNKNWTKLESSKNCKKKNSGKKIQTAKTNILQINDEFIKIIKKLTK